MDTSLRIFSSFITLFLGEWRGGEGLRSSVLPIVSNIGNMYDSASLGGVTSRLTSDNGSASCRGDVREKDSGNRKVCTVARGISTIRKVVVRKRMWHGPVKVQYLVHTW